MASGFGTFNSSNYYAQTSLTGVKCSAVVSQSVNSANRTVTISVRAMMSFYRISTNWSLSAGTDIAYNTSNSYYVKATVDGSSSQLAKLGIEANKAFTATGGSTYRQSDGYIRSISGYNSEATKTATFSYGADGAAITKTWSATVYYGGTTMTVSGTVTTDAISPLSKLYGSVNGNSVKIKKLYCSVGGVSKKVKKLYGSVNGQSVSIFEA